ncbi:hypothetical protein PpBr36_04286 [Pyricularia pennisetigena]|uniref:hypothetical protein n=1 Tax=Pyricularia pennisetigena TaxID=1578925 RepID=UPI001153C325|nr:hypothetical protein PpBr36_04286 [Pyricularia pennisetigena]TLS26755.1 hypothetical protein PpBr36_04286 [Pyricularia pennisetigena]
MSRHNATGIVFAIPPPPGVKVDPDAPLQADDLIAVFAIFFTLAAISCGVRIYTRAYLTGRLAMDDYVMFAALLSTAILTGAMLDMLRWGMTKDMWNVPLTPDIWPNFMVDRLISSVAYCFATGLAKGSILLFYLRIFPTSVMRWTIWILFIFTVGYSVASALINIFSCAPVEASWRLEYAETGRCIDRPVFYLVHGSLCIVTDITTVVTPLPWLKSLRLPLKEKIGVGLVLTIGAFVCCVSIIRMRMLVLMLKDPNVSYTIKGPAFWAIIETSLSIIGGNATTLRPFGRHVSARLSGVFRFFRRGDAFKLPWSRGKKGPTSTTSESKSRAHDVGYEELGAQAFAGAVLDKRDQELLQSSCISRAASSGLRSQGDKSGIVSFADRPGTSEPGGIKKIVEFGFEESPNTASRQS